MFTPEELAREVINSQHKVIQDYSNLISYDDDIDFYKEKTLKSSLVTIDWLIISGDDSAIEAKDILTLKLSELIQKKIK